MAEFPGRFGWGYDGVNLFAPTRLYGTPDDFRRFVDRAHAAGLGVILDVVYNHFGPDGNYLKQFADDYFTDRYKNEWGEAINFDGADAGPVREFFVANAGYWIDEFHLDGLRLDATQHIYDASRRAHPRRDRRDASRRGRAGPTTLLVAENEPQEARLVRPPSAAATASTRCGTTTSTTPPCVALTGRNEAYYTDYLRQPAGASSPPSSTATSTRASATTGRRSAAARPASTCRRRRSSPSSRTTTRWPTPAAAARCHQLDQPRPLPGDDGAAAARPRRRRCCSRGRSSPPRAPFLYFADHKPELARAGRARAGGVPRAVPQPRHAGDAGAASPIRPTRATFERCKLDLAERERHAPMLRAAPRPAAAAPRGPGLPRPAAPAASTARCSATEAFVLRFFGRRPGDDRLLLVNLGRDLHLTPAPEPLLGAAGRARAGRCSGRARTRATAAAARRRSRTTSEAGASPGEAAVVLRPVQERRSMSVAEVIAIEQPTRTMPCSRPEMPRSESGRRARARRPADPRVAGDQRPGRLRLRHRRRRAPRAATTACSSPPCPRRWAAA